MKQKSKAKGGETVNLALFCENPDNPSVATDEDIQRLAGKLKRVPLGLTAMRIAYVTDMDGDERTRGKRVVISGNKRLRVLKQAYGEDGEVPAEWFADVTAMSEAERHEFIVTANVSDGEWDVDRLLAQYDRAELGELMGEELIRDLINTENYENYDVEKGILRKNYIVPPFSVIDTKESEWQERKKAWRKTFGSSTDGRDDELTFTGGIVSAMGCRTGTSEFDPVLCEVLLKWFCPKNGTVLDPFAGGIVRGAVSASMGMNYYGCDLSEKQVAANINGFKKHEKTEGDAYWQCGDSVDIKRIIKKREFDFILSCPPYADLEVYSDDKRDISNMEYPDFISSYRKIINSSVSMLKQDAFIAWVVGEVRDKGGIFRNFIGDTISAFADAGAMFYNSIVLLNAIGSACIRSSSIFKRSRKVSLVHQNVLIFVKGDYKNILARLHEADVPECEVGV